MPAGETVILVQISDRTDLKSWWVIVNGDSVDLCLQNPGHDVDVYLTATLANLVALWLGDVGLREAIEAETVFLDGPRHLTDSAPDWMAQSPLIGVKPASMDSRIVN